uniref:PR domain containing 9 n=1 Tax=Cyprinus carpio carpio TaxID=630221 RepID=A0A8C1DAH4_CYPCA
MSDSPDFPPSDEQNLETQGSITNSSSVEMMEGQEDSLFNDQHFYCEMCHQHFIDQCEVHGPPLFTRDSTAAMGIPQRALLTLPQGLVIGRSSISNAGLGVFNQGETVPLGMHFGPFDGEVTSQEKALDSAFSWVIYRALLFAFVTEQNLVAFQQNGRILFRCCRPVSPGQEFRVWYAEEYAQGLGIIWDKIWDKKCISLGTTEEQASQDCLCPYCHCSFPTIFYLRAHVKRSHPDEYAHFIQTRPLESVDIDQSLLSSDAAPPTHMQPVIESCQGQISTLNGQPIHQSEKSDCADLSDTCSNGLSDQTNCVTEVTGEMNKCGECGRNFLRSCHLKRHQRTIHSKEKPYCCSRCRKCFSQATGLKRHQQTHQGEEKREKDADRPSDIYPCTKCSFSFVAKFNLHQHLKRHHHGEYLRLVESGSLTVGTEGDTEKNSDKHDPTYDPPTRGRRPVKNTLRGRSRTKKVPLGRPRGRPPKTKNAAEDEVQKSLPICTECEQTFSDLETLKTHQCAVQDNDNKIEEPQEAPASQHVCGECLRAFNNFDLLKAHECIQQGDRSYCCFHCNLYFNRMCNLRRHERTIHSKEKPYCCTLCLKSFTQSSGLKRHQQSHSRCKAHRQSSALVDATIFPCTYCPFSFTDERYLYKHIRRHHPEMSVKYLSFQEGGVLSVEKPHSCSQCCKSFSTIRGFKNHSCFKQGERVYLCPDCGKAFIWFNSLKQHQRIHTGEKPYPCQQCGKSFVHAGQLNVHLRTHTGEKPFLCSECGESFRQSGDLRRHEQKHSGVRPCQCPDCGKSFSRPQSLKAHQQLHNGTKLFPCTQCGKSFTRRYHLTRHHQKMHS